LIGSRPIIDPGTGEVAKWLGPRGEAENFARKAGSLKIPVGMRVVFCLSKNLEGVWYPHSFGRLGTSVVVQLRRPNLVNVDPNQVDPNELWVTLGKDGAGDVRRGPSIGRAKVGVPVRFRKPGDYLLRAIVTTYAQPLRLKPNTPASDEDTSIDVIALPGAGDRDVVYVKVRVVDLPIKQIQPDEQPSLDPDAENVLPIPKEIYGGDTVTLDADLNGDERVDLADLAIFNQQWGQEQELPVEDW
jgi:hypothetical protein